MHRHFYPVRFVAQLIPCNAKRLQRLLGEFLKRREVFLEAELAAKSDDELPVRLALAQGDQFLRHSVEESRFRPLGQQMQTRLIALQIAGGGEHDVSELSGRRHEDVLYHQQVEALQGLDDVRGIREASHRVVADHDVRPNRIRLVVQHRVIQRWRMRVRIGRHVERLETVAADALGVLLGRQFIPQFRVVEFGRVVEHVAARHVEIAGDPHQD